MAFCTHCGASVPDGAQFCTRCGTPLTPAGDSAPFVPEPQGGAQQAFAPESAPLQPSGEADITAPASGGAFVSARWTLPKEQARPQAPAQPPQYAQPQAPYGQQPYGAQPFAQPQAPYQQPYGQQPQYYSQQAPARKKNLSMGKILLIAVLVIVVLSVVSWLLGL